MSQEAGPGGGGRRDGASGVATQSFPPQYYPVTGYQGHPHAWFPPHPSPVPGPWSPSWRPPMGYPAPTPPWPAQHTPSTAPSDEYTVDTLRRIYKDDDGRVEIQRVKVQRRPPESGAVTLSAPEAMSVVPVGALARNERRPPPRKHRRKPEIQAAAVGPTRPYPWYPYMPCMPYPYPYPYYLAGCAWPPGAPSDSVSSWSGHQESQALSSHQDSACNSQRLESRASRDALPSLLYRSSSPAAASHITDHITDTHSLAPSDSVSVRGGRRRETSMERALRGPTPPPRTRSRAPSSLGGKSEDAGKTQEWMLEMQRALRPPGDAAVRGGDKGAPRTDHTEAYKRIPPVRKRRKFRAGMSGLSGQSSLTDLKDADDVSEIQSVVSDARFDESSKLSSELNYAFRKFERSVDAFKTEIANNPSPQQSSAASPSEELLCPSTGEATPTDPHGTPPPLSDIRGLAERANIEEGVRYDRYQRPRAISESVSSFPALETVKAGSLPDISCPLLTPASSSQHTTSIEPRSATLGPTRQCVAAPTTPTPQEPRDTEPVVKTTEGTSKVDPAFDVPLKPASSAGTSPIPDAANVIHASSTPLDPHTAHPSHTQSPPTPSEQTTIHTDTTIATLPPQHCNPPHVKLTDTPSEQLPDASVTSNPATSEAIASGDLETGDEGSSKRHSRASSATTFFSVRTTDDSHSRDTDSTDIPLPTTDSATADENEESAGSGGPEEPPPWVLQRPEETPTLNTAGQDECRSAWRAEVSLWRARLVVSLCRGEGLDRQDWATLLLMVHHPLAMDLKLSLLHAPRLCTANSTVGPAVLRVALLQLVQHGEALLQPEAARQPGWSGVRRDAAHAWTNVKGGAEILHSLGYHERGHSPELQYRRRGGPEASVVARLTLDMLVLAEELRLFLTGTHQYPNNVSTLFFPESLGRGSVADLPPRPPSSEGSFVSALSEAAPVARPPSKASSITDTDTDTLHTRVTETTGHSLLRNISTSEDDTLREEDHKEAAAENVSARIEGLKSESIQQSPSEPEAKTSPEGHHLPAPPTDQTAVHADATSPPEPLSEHSRTITPERQQPSVSAASSVNQANTPASPPSVTPQAKSSSKADEDNTAATPAAGPNTDSDNPEEHVYEEIDVVRAQAQSLRASSVPTQSPPPPLPPKTKTTSGGDSESVMSLAYPAVQWSSASTPASLHGGSTGARRKKRRAPMPPEFLSQHWKESKETPDEEVDRSAKTHEPKGPDATKQAEYRRSLNPFYEEIDSLIKCNAKETDANKDAARKDKQDNEAAHGNPFLEDPAKATGYIGKNPFYDDIEILKKSHEYKELKTKQSSPAAATGEGPSTAGDVPEQQTDAPAVRPKRRAPRPPPTPQDTRTARPPHDTQQDERKSVYTHEYGGDRIITSTPAITRPPDRDIGGCTTHHSKAKYSDPTITFSSKTPAPPPPTQTNNPNPSVNNPTTENTAQESVPPIPPPKDLLNNPSTENTALKQESVPPFPPPKDPLNNPSTENTALKQESVPPIPPKAPLSLLDEIPYMDANEVREARAQRQLKNPHPHVAITNSPVVTHKFSPVMPRQPSLTLPLVKDVDLPPDCPPPLPPRPPPESPPETPHTSPPETPHTSPPETPHTSPPVTPRPSPRPSPLFPSRRHPQDSLVKTEEGIVHERAVKDIDEDEPPPVPAKTVPLGTPDDDASILTPPHVSLQEQTPHPPHPPQASSIPHNLVTGTNSVQSSIVEERYEIPDTSRAPPPRPPILILSKTQQQQQQQGNGKTSTPPAEYARYEVPEAPKHPVVRVSKAGGATIKTPETEERYEIPEVVKEQALRRQVNGKPFTVTLGRTSSPRRGEITAVFGPPKPPRRRRHNHSPPPRPPKHPGLIGGSLPGGLSDAPPRPASTSSSFTSSSSGYKPSSVEHKKPLKRRSWPFLLCDCLYVNCRSYDDAYK
ncbi:hypothetical protein GWK47_021591 [Chionoecetes opilio]|uniref:Uncharacterized protein n=1 Tax=Chionoecetes opilio TaxID=41210 RepID=A0A8J5CHU0_CHIOP|nr:hypothetical protein GWK47_021591 [Chionoecetes opilio]